MTRKPFPDIMRTSCGKREREVNTVENQESIYEEKQGNLLTGILGAFLGALIGTALWVLVGVWGYIAGIVADSILGGQGL